MAYLCNDEIKQHACYAVYERQQHWEVPTNVVEEDSIEKVAYCVEDKPQ